MLKEQWKVAKIDEWLELANKDRFYWLPDGEWICYTEKGKVIYKYIYKKKD